MHYSHSAAHARQAPALVSADFSLDEFVQQTLPSDTPLDFMRVAGPFSYCATLDIRHGDLLGVIPDRDSHPDNLLLVKIGPSFFIRKRAQIEHTVRQMSMYIVGRPPRTIANVVGLIICVHRILQHVR